MLYLTKLFICFAIYSFIGWVLEVLYGLYELKKFVNRGFLIGPVCPIYGIGCVFIYLFLSGLKSDAIVLFLASCLLCSILEYVASYVLEKVFNVRWWDYNNMKFNLNGRVCLEMAIPFGILGLFDVYLLLPYTFKLLDMMSDNIIYIIGIVLFVIFIIDAIISIILIIKFKNSALKSNEKDNTIEIDDYIKRSLSKDLKYAKRLVKTFPHLKIIRKLKREN